MRRKFQKKNLLSSRSLTCSEKMKNVTIQSASKKNVSDTKRRLTEHAKTNLPICCRSLLSPSKPSLMLYRLLINSVKL